MDATPLPLASRDDWSESFGATLAAQRARVREFLGVQQTRLARAERQLADQLQLLRDELSRETQQSQLTRREIHERQEEIARELATLERLNKQLAQRRAGWEELQQRTNVEQAALDERFQRQQQVIAEQRAALAGDEQALLERQAELARAQHESAAAATELAARRAELEAAARRLDERQRELDAKLSECAERAEKTEAQRRRLARELGDRHTAEHREIERLRAELDRRDGAERDALKHRAELAESHLVEMQAEMTVLREQAGRWQQSAQESAAHAEADWGLIGKLQAEITRLQSELDAAVVGATEASDRTAAAEQQLTQALAAPPPTDGESDEYRRRYELAMDDLRELKAKNAEMQKELARLKSGERGQAPAAASGVLSWEVEKQRILAALELAGDDVDPRNRDEHVQIREIVARTDRLLAEKDKLLLEKDREIEELRQAGASAGFGAVAVGAGAFSEFLDKDAVIKEHREHLEALRKDLEEKLRQAEIEISVERAKLARERAKLDERLRANPPAGAPAEPSIDLTKSVRGKWLTRLGIKNDQSGGS